MANDNLLNSLWVYTSPTKTKLAWMLSDWNYEWFANTLRKRGIDIVWFENDLPILERILSNKIC